MGERPRPGTWEKKREWGNKVMRGGRQRSESGEMGGKKRERDGRRSEGGDGEVSLLERCQRVMVREDKDKDNELKRSRQQWVIKC